MTVVSYLVEVCNNTKEDRTIVANTLAIYNSVLNYVVNVVKETMKKLNQGILK